VERIVSKTVDYQNKTRMHAASSGSATVALSVPPFTARELHEGVDEVLAKGPTSTLYSLEAIWTSL
ncbi:Serine/threonine protein kinase, partial [Giardia duodenalis]